MLAQMVQVGKKSKEGRRMMNKQEYIDTLVGEGLPRHMAEEAPWSGPGNLWSGVLANEEGRRYDASPKYKSPKLRWVGDQASRIYRVKYAATTDIERTPHNAAEIDGIADLCDEIIKTKVCTGGDIPSGSQLDEINAMYEEASARLSKLRKEISS